MTVNDERTERNEQSDDLTVCTAEGPLGPNPFAAAHAIFWQPRGRSEHRRCGNPHCLWSRTALARDLMAVLGDRVDSAPRAPGRHALLFCRRRPRIRPLFRSC